METIPLLLLAVKVAYPLMGKKLEGNKMSYLRRSTFNSLRKRYFCCRRTGRWK